MTTFEQKVLWDLLVKYDDVLDNTSNALSSILQNTHTSTEYITLFSSYSKMDNSDKNRLDKLIGNEIINSINIS